MEPLPPELRAALKEAHPGLNDATIDRTEALLSERLMCDPETEQDEIAQLALQRRTLMRQAMPRYMAVVRAFHDRQAQLAAHTPQPVKKVTVRPKRPR